MNRFEILSVCPHLLVHPQSNHLKTLQLSKLKLPILWNELQNFLLLILSELRVH